MILIQESLKFNSVLKEMDRMQRMLKYHFTPIKHKPSEVDSDPTDFFVEIGKLAKAYNYK